MNWPADNSYFQVKQWFEENLVEHYSEREGQNITRIILERNANMSRALLIAKDYKFSESQLNSLADSISELRKGKPLQQVMGSAFFLDLELQVNEHTLIPRPETEELVMLAAKQIPEGGRVMDIGTGTGAIALALKYHRPDLVIEGCDVSQQALAVAGSNASELNLDVSFTHKDILNENLSGTYDAIISNPPYIPHADKMNMENGVLNFEPHLALFVEDANPLEFYHRIISLANNHLSSNGQLYFECHKSYAQGVAEACKPYFQEVMLFQDLQANDRMVMANVLKSHH